MLGNLYELSLVNPRIVRVMPSTVSSPLVLTTLTGGGARIFLPNLPVFRCHHPDLGLFPSSLFFCAEPTGVELCSTLLNLPTVHMLSCGKLNSFLLGVRMTTRPSGVFLSIVAKVPAACTRNPPRPGYGSTQFI